jgi:hypothetical protein
VDELEVHVWSAGECVVIAVAGDAERLEEGLQQFVRDRRQVPEPQQDAGLELRQVLGPAVRPVEQPIRRIVGSLGARFVFGGDVELLTGIPNASAVR